MTSSLLFHHCTAYTWDHYLKDTSQPEWLLRFPMVKATLRAMDTITGRRPLHHHHEANISIGSC